MARMIDQIRASKLPSNMMQFAARGALQVPAAENIEILVYLAKYNNVFGELARITLAGWDEHASVAVAADPKTPAEVLNYFISGDNLRPKLLPALLDNSSVREEQIVKLAASAMRDIIDILLKSDRVRSSRKIVDALKSSPYLKKEEAEELERSLANAVQPPTDSAPTTTPDSVAPDPAAPSAEVESNELPEEAAEESADTTFGAEDETVFSYLKEHAADIAAEGERPFQAIGGVLDLVLGESSSTGTSGEASGAAPQSSVASAATPATAVAKAAALSSP